MADGKKKDQQDKMTRLTATATELNILKGVTSLASEINFLDSSVNAALMTPGTGISTGVGTIVKYGVYKRGSVFETQIMIDLTGLHDGDAAEDIVGVDTGTANCHFGQITTAVNGAVWGGELQCFETPAGGSDDFNIWASTADTGAQDAGAAALAGASQLLNGGAQAAGSWSAITTPPAANSYLYLSTGTSVDAIYTAGRFLLTFYGVTA
jgi:hypothetical protein